MDGNMNQPKLNPASADFKLPEPEKEEEKQKEEVVDKI